MLRQLGSAIGLASASAIVNITNHWNVQKQLASSHLPLNPSQVQMVFSRSHFLQTFPLDEQSKIMDIAKNALAVAINFSALWTSVVVIVMWIIAFKRTRTSPGFLKEDRS